MTKFLLALFVLIAAGLGVFFYPDSSVDPDVAPDASAPPTFLKGHYVTFATRTFEGPINEIIAGLPEGFTLRALSDNQGERLRGLKVLLEIDGHPVDQQALAHKTGEDVLLSTDRGTLRARILEWIDFDERDATASGVEVQFDFMYPKD